MIGGVAHIDGLSGAAYAQQGQGRGGQGGGGQGGGAGQGQQGGGGAGGSDARGSGAGGPTVPHAEGGEDSEESDRPSWAGQGGGGNPQPGVGDANSDRPSWAGKGATKPNSGSGGGKPATDRGDLYGDLYVIVRDTNGAPVLYVWEDRNGDGVTEPYADPSGFPQPIAADGSLIPLDAEGHPVDATLTPAVDLGRLNVARSPEKVTDHSLTEAVASLNSATDVRTDAAGRLEVLVDGEWKTINSPLENIALYLDLMKDGTVTGLTNPAVIAKFPNLTDGQITAADFKTAESLLAAAADKYTTLSLNSVMYINNILGVNDPANGSYVNLTSVSYDRSDTYANVTAQVLLDPEGDGTYTVQTVNIYDAVFKNTDTTATGATGFTQAIDDARAVIAYVHDNAPRTTE